MKGVLCLFLRKFTRPFYVKLSFSFRMVILYHFQTPWFSALKSNFSRRSKHLNCLPSTTMAPNMPPRILMYNLERTSTKVTLSAILLHVNRLLLKLARMGGHTTRYTFHWLIHPRVEHFLKSRGGTEVYYVKQFLHENVHKNSWQRLFLNITIHQEIC